MFTFDVKINGEKESKVNKSLEEFISLESFLTTYRENHHIDISVPKIDKGLNSKSLSTD